MLQHCEVPYLLHKVQSQRSALHWVESCPVLWIKEKKAFKKSDTMVRDHTYDKFTHKASYFLLQKAVLIFRLNPDFKYYTAGQEYCSDGVR